MRAQDLLNVTKFGNSVAEFDADLEQYFVETETFRSVIADAGDIIAGDKGTGKTAIYKVLKRNYRRYEDLDSVEIIDAFNIQGSPIFQRLLNGPALTEAQYRTVWKAYILALAGNWILDIYGKNFNPEMTELHNTLAHLDLLSEDVAPETIFGRLHSLIKRLSNPEALEAKLTISETGMPIVIPRVELGEIEPSGEEIYCDDFLAILDRAARTTELKFWILFDRLDEAFAGNLDIEIPALRALMRAYLDLNALEGIRLKIFVRKDLFRRIINGGFVNLTHVNARRIDIVWDEDDLVNMVARRLKRDEHFTGWTQTAERPDAHLISILLPPQVDPGDRKPTSHNWIMSRIRDGNNNKPPRNLIDILNKARESQLRREARQEREIDPLVGPIIEPESIKRAFAQLSETRIQDTVLAEAGELAPIIELFRDGKSEHNMESLARTLGVDDLETRIRALSEMGFLEEFGENFKIPMLYRDGLGITQGKAF